ncbi:MAG: sigma-70 family RNA polymerase sigma factor [Acidobacteriota bacterium]
MANAELSIKEELSSASEFYEVVVRSQQGDGEAFQLLFQRYSKPILEFIYNMVGEKGLAEELMQESFVRAYRNLANLKEPAKFSTWLFGIAKNTVRETFKKRGEANRKVALDEPISLQLEDSKIRPDERIFQTELNLALRRALLALNEDWRTVFVLKILNQQSYEEIAEITGWSIGKVKTDLHRARLEIKRRLNAYLS